MPLSRRKKRRLTDICKMINTSLDMLVEMKVIQLDYNDELNRILTQIRRSTTEDHPQAPSSASTDLLFSNEEEAPDFDNTSVPPPEISHDPPKIQDDTPPWVKLLWKKIMMKVHPDRIDQQKLSLVEIVKRQKYILTVQDAYANKNWTKVLFIGIQVDEFTEEISNQQQIQMLEKLSTQSNQEITDIQNTLAWQWGQCWSSIEDRIKIITHCCQLQHIDLPSKAELIKILVNLEVE